MKSPRRSILAMLDDTVRWTGMPARIADQMSNDPERKFRPLRWMPIWPIAVSVALLVVSLAWPPALRGLHEGLILSGMTVFWCGVFGLIPAIYAYGPLGKPSQEDDEREAALRKDSFVFCLALIAVFNCLGQPAIMILSHWQDWEFAQIASVVTSAVMVNVTLLGCAPTLHASWKLRPLSKE